MEVSVTPVEAAVGDRLKMVVTVDLPQGISLDPTPIGPELGPFTIMDGQWSPPAEAEEGRRWIWSGSMAAFRTGALEVPPISVRANGPEGELSLSSEPVSVRILSVLTEEDLDQEAAELADLKGPVSVPPEYGPLWRALSVMGLLLGGALLLWWLHRRYGARLAAVAVPEDPFHRTPPHEWIFAELQRLLGHRLPEQGKIEQFYGELSWILKRYLTGRYRVELMEATSAEVPSLLRQSGVGKEAIHSIAELLAESDRVKFARSLPDAAAWRTAVERVYRIVDATKPAEVGSASARKGAA
jgi:hypothetical protein